ncbi:MAG TPA: hypothetical protein VJY41_01025 [Prolixibacteraceae bacterium]|nr:hypothetical protein [Prolixibacteraceae bacterium]
MNLSNYKQFAFSLLVITVLFSNMLWAQEEKKVDFKLYGFIRNDIYIDTYKGIDGAHEQYYLLPVYVGKDANGKDINQQLSSNLTAITSRLGINVNGPDIFGAKSMANIEIDFGGVVSTEPTLIRIRKANAALTWDKSKLLMGQDWHPFWSGDICPYVASLNTGAPFQPFNRSPQIRYDYKAGKVKLSAAAVYQLQYQSRSMQSTQNTPTQAKRNGVVPELIANIEYRNNALAFGGGISHNRTKPKMTVIASNGNKYNSTSYLNSVSYIGYARYKTEKLTVLLKGVYGQNMSHLLLPGGYAIAQVDSITGQEKYSNYNNFTSYLNMVYGKKWQVGFFAGIGKNFGTSDKLMVNSEGNATSAGLFYNVQDFYRISPFVALNVANLRLMFEYEQTTANYGIGGFNSDKGLYSVVHKVSNNRLLFTMMYMF